MSRDTGRALLSHTDTQSYRRLYCAVNIEPSASQRSASSRVRVRHPASCAHRLTSADRAGGTTLGTHLRGLEPHTYESSNSICSWTAFTPARVGQVARRTDPRPSIPDVPPWRLRSPCASCRCLAERAF